MEKVASHINEMQKIYEDYGTVFDQLVAEQSGPEKEVHTILELHLKAKYAVYFLFMISISSLCVVFQVTEISMGEFIIHSSALWQNPRPSLGRMRKDPVLTLFRKSGLIYCNFKNLAVYAVQYMFNIKESVH